MSGALSACCRQLLSRRPRFQLPLPAQPVRSVLMMGPHDPLVPDDVEPGANIRVKQEVPENAKLTYQQRMADWRAKHCPEPPACDIGLPRSLLTSKESPPPDKERLASLERLSRNHRLRVDLDAVERVWEFESRPEHALAAARHYGIMEHLFGPGCFFHPVVPLRAHFSDPDQPGRVRPAALGNLLAPRHCAEAPELTWPNLDTPVKWTVLLTCPDEHLQSAEREYAHWLVTDVPGSGRVADGRTLMPYLQPIPPHGTGWHRYALLLFLQTDGSGPVEFPQQPQRQRRAGGGGGGGDGGQERLADRDFSTAEFYRANEDRLTPAGLCFFQAAWDDSVRAVYRHRLADMGVEPAFQFCWPPPHRPKMEQFAFSEPFNIYLDKYRDSKDIAEEVLKEKLKSVHPFTGRRRSESKYPLAAPADGYRPSWLAEREKEKVLRKGQWSGLDSQ